MSMGRGLEDGGDWDSLDSFCLCLCLCLLLCFRSVSRSFPLFRLGEDEEESESEFDGLQVCCMRWRGVRKGQNGVVLANDWEEKKGRRETKERQAQLAQGKRGCTNALGSLAARKNA